MNSWWILSHTDVLGSAEWETSFQQASVMQYTLHRLKHCHQIGFSSLHLDIKTKMLVNRHFEKTRRQLGSGAAAPARVCQTTVQPSAARTAACPCCQDVQRPTQVWAEVIAELWVNLGVSGKNAASLLTGKGVCFLVFWLWFFLYLSRCLIVVVLTVVFAFIFI